MIARWIWLGLVLSALSAWPAAAAAGAIESWGPETNLSMSPTDSESGLNHRPLAVTSDVPVALPPGSYVASETEVAGYVAGSWGGDCAADGSVTLAAGENKTCTITNDDLPSTLTLIKTVINDDGSTAAVDDFALFIDALAVTRSTAQRRQSETKRMPSVAR